MKVQNPGLKNSGRGRTIERKMSGGTNNKYLVD